MSAAILPRLRDALKDRYLVEREIGEGGAATVYLAHDIKHNRNVAIKVFRPELAETLGAERFSREIRTAANLNHPHILAVLDSGSADGLLYYVMPFAEGESLRARITREGGLPITDVIRILREVADALSAAHAAGVVHRDIKPDNVLLSGRHAAVADFGVAKAISESTGNNAITTLGVALGTPAYMAPEQAAADPHVDHRADIYALGILGYEMLTGEPPFVRRTPQEVLAAHVTEAAPNVSVRRQSVPPALDAMIVKCLVKQPADRYQSAEDIVAELERMGTPMAGMSAVVGIAPTLARPAATAPRAAWIGSRFVVFAVAAVVVLVAGWVAVTKLRSGRATNADVVAVFPFEYSGSPALNYLREGIVNVLEVNLTGEAGPRAVASQTMIAQWKRKGGDQNGLTEQEARILATELGAGQIVRGSIVSAGTELLISATLTPVGGANPVQAQVKGPADSIAALATRLAGQLLSLRVGESADRLVALQSVPPKALQAYLMGQQALRASRFIDSYNAFTVALGLDSTFALAAMGLNTAQSWSPVNLGAADGVGIAFRHRDKLGPRDLIVLEMTAPAQFAGHPLTLRELTDIRERLVQQVSDRAEGWYLIGDNYMHRGTAMGLSRSEAFKRSEYAFRRVLQLDPGVTYVQMHLAQMHMSIDSLARVRQVADSFGLKTPEIDVVLQVYGGDSVDVRHYAETFRRLNADQLMAVGAYTAGTLIGDSANAEAMARSTDARQRVRLTGFVRGSAWVSGRPKQAEAQADRLAKLAQSPADLNPGSIVIAGLFDGGDSAAAGKAAATVAKNLQLGAFGTQAQFADRFPAFQVGMWAAKTADSTMLRAALARLDAIAARRDSAPQAAIAKLYADGLRLVAAPGEPDRARLASFDSVMSQGPAISAMARAALNVIASRNWERARETSKAAVAAERAATWEMERLVQTTVQRDVGRLKLAAGDTAGALYFWKTYLMYRGRAEPSQRKLDDEIRATIAEIERKKR